MYYSLHVMHQAATIDASKDFQKTQSKRVLF